MSWLLYRKQMLINEYQIITYITKQIKVNQFSIIDVGSHRFLIYFLHESFHKFHHLELWNLFALILKYLKIKENVKDACRRGNGSEFHNFDEPKH